MVRDVRDPPAMPADTLDVAINALAGTSDEGEHLTEERKGPFTKIVERTRPFRYAPVGGDNPDFNADQANPKDLLGVKKVPLGLLPAAARIYGAEAMRHGAEKYGPYNWRSKAVKMTIYLDAIERHLLALRDGQCVDVDSGVHHCGHIIACAAIILDAADTGNLIEDNHHDGPAAQELSDFDRTER